MILFDVFLPTFDVYGDASLVIPWYNNGHHLYAMLMTIPMLLNYVCTSYKWWSLEKRPDKKWTWILVVLQLWQQWRAIKIIYLFFKKDARAQEKKKTMLKEISSIEPFSESVPAILIMTFIWVHADIELQTLVSPRHWQQVDSEVFRKFRNFSRGQMEPKNCTDPNYYIHRH